MQIKSLVVTLEFTADEVAKLQKIGKNTYPLATVLCESGPQGYGSVKDPEEQREWARFFEKLALVGGE